MPAFLTINNGGSLDMNGFNAGVGRLNGSGTVHNVAGYGRSVLTLGNGGSGTFSGTIQNSGPNGNLALVKTGSGTQYLNGVNTYGGATTVNGGVLAAGAGNAGLGPFERLCYGRHARRHQLAAVDLFALRGRDPAD